MSILSDIAEDDADLEMTPMIDVTFLLLIFFMCTIKFKTLEGKLTAYLPKDVGTSTKQADPVEKVEIRIDVIQPGGRLNPEGTGPWSGEGRFIFDKSRVVQYRVGPKRSTDLDEIHAQLKKLYAADPERGATIDARKGVVYEDVVRVLDRALEVNFKEITFVASFE